MAEKGYYATASHLVGVSGGGYAAAAYWAARRRRDDGKDPFGPGSPDLLALRNRTNYLASSARVRWELFTSLLTGFMFNLLLFAAVAGVWIWVLANCIPTFGLAEAKPRQVRVADQLWEYGDPVGWWLACLPAALPLVVAVVLFIIDRAHANDFFRTPLYSTRAAHGWWSNFPLSLNDAALTWLAALPGLTWLAIALHNFWYHRTAVWLEFNLEVTALTGVSVIALFGALVKSVWKGLQSSTTKDEDPTFWTNALSIFRTWAAPRLAMGLITAAAVVGVAAAYSYLLTDNIMSSTRALWLPGASFVIILVAIIIGANDTTMHTFYRDRLAHAYLDHEPNQGDKAWELNFEKLHPDDADDQVGHLPPPTLVLCATANIFDDNEILPVGRNGTPFVMSHDSVGFTDTTRLPGGQLNWRTYTGQSKQAITLAQAVAISGAAVSPVQGRDSTLIAYRALFAIANVRLGVWLPNPFWAAPSTQSGWWRPKLEGLERRFNRPTGLKVFTEAFARSFKVTSPHIYVTDGGHYDNLGILEALQLQPDHLIVLDGSGDAEDQFPTMGRAIATARMDSNIEITFDPTPMLKGTKDAPTVASTRANARWADGNTTHKCDIMYIKCIKPPTSLWDLEAYQLQHPEFPATSSSLEMYNEFEFEAFHHLGYQVALEAELPTVTSDPKRSTHWWCPTAG